MAENDIQYSRENTIAAWHRFIESGTIPEGMVRRPVAESWLRCRELGVDPFGATYPHMSRQVLNKMQQENHVLLSYAIPCLRLLRSAAGAGGVSLISPSLFVYYMLSEYESEPLSYGIYLDERTCGNTAMSIASHEHEAAFLHKYEKFRLIDQTTSSAAAPIRVGGELAGYIALSVTSGLSSEHMMALVNCTAGFIGELYAGGLGKDGLMAGCQRIIDLAHRPILLMDSTGAIIAANSDCRRFISTKRPDGSPARIADSLVDLDDLSCFSLDGSAHGHNSCNIRTIYNTTFNCEIISKESICFPEGNKFAAITIEVSPPGRQVNAKEPAAIPSLPSRPVNVEYVGVSMEWSKIDHVISRIAKYPSNVLIQGESGTGKEVVARTIHNLSGRSGNFVAINCGDIPEGLLQSEFFGYEKGSFTGANREGRMGKFEYADHGTVFLDEIGDMPLSMQVSLLRFIQERTVQRIGSNQTKPVDVRIVAATNKNIEEMIKNQLFRNDLYYRLNIIGITLPPLRDRKDDIPVLAQYFAKSISSQYGLPVPEIDPDVYNIFNRYDWPGNVRELRNVIEKLLIMSDGQRITAHSVYAYVFDYDTFNGSSIAGGEASEKDRIATSLIANRGNVSKTAAEFGIARDTLYRKMKKYGITANRGVS